MLFPYNLLIYFCLLVAVLAVCQDDYFEVRAEVGAVVKHPSSGLELMNL